MYRNFDWSKCAQLIQRVTLYFAKYSAREGEKYGLSAAESHVLLFLHDNPKIDSAFQMSKIGMPVSKAYISKAVAGLALKGLVSVEKDEEDRRIQHIKLNDKAVPAIDRLVCTRDRYIKTLIEDIEDEEIAVLMQIVKKIENKKDCLKSL